MGRRNTIPVPESRRQSTTHNQRLILQRSRGSNKIVHKKERNSNFLLSQHGNKNFHFHSYQTFLQKDFKINQFHPVEMRTAMHKNSMKLWMIECTVFLEESILLWFARTEIYIFSKNQLLNLKEERYSSETAKSECEQLISAPNISYISSQCNINLVLSSLCLTSCLFEICFQNITL